MVEHSHARRAQDLNLNGCWSKNHGWEFFEKGLIFYRDDKTLEIEHDREKIIFYLLSGTNPILIPLQKKSNLNPIHNYNKILFPRKQSVTVPLLRIERLECCNLTFSESLRIYLYECSLWFDLSFRRKYSSGDCHRMGSRGLSKEPYQHQSERTY